MGEFVLTATSAAVEFTPGFRNRFRVLGERDDSLLKTTVEASAAALTIPHLKDDRTI
ncbi:hypothetical protein AB0M46_13635 [Dactylosporangium sp. NPDC051485]|uniref:hypothetical protein n=1 Tax=Dactylosporangium sp. NPDC051485 TaxID=3154846 RepID=UPI0034304789